jgi:hypothetical protein
MTARSTSLIAWIMALSCLTACSAAAGGRNEELSFSSDGLGVVNMGDSYEDVRARLSERWGPVTEDRRTSCESFEPVRMVMWASAYVVFGSEGLIGYVVGPFQANGATVIDQDLAKGETPEGLRLGATVARATELYGSRFSFFPESTLGDEFVIRDGSDEGDLLSGFTDESDSDSRITHMFAGEVCAAR